MKKAVLILLLSVLAFAPGGCSPEKIGKSSGIGVVFEGSPRIVDSTVIYMGATVGRILSSQWANGVTRLTISLEPSSLDLSVANMVAVVKNGQLNLVQLSGAGDPQSAANCMPGFKSRFEMHWFRLKNLIGNVNLAAARRTQRLLTLSGLAG